jgi:hypothetical protein
LRSLKQVKTIRLLFSISLFVSSQYLESSLTS